MKVAPARHAMERPLASTHQRAQNDVRSGRLRAFPFAKESRPLMAFSKHLKIQTRGHGDVQDLTDAVSRLIGQSGIETGLVHLFNIGSTAAIGALEAEPGLMNDLPAALDQVIPPGTHYEHEQAWHDGNAHSHLQATLLGPGITVPIEGGCLVLGTWQQIVLVECDTRPRERAVVVTVLGD
jgi:secondary thiamine-phosphate synthase enzyme